MAPRMVLLVMALGTASLIISISILRWWNTHQRTALYDEYRTAVTAKIDGIERLRGVIAAIPPVTHDALTAGAVPPVMVGYDHLAESNGAVAYLEDLADLSRGDKGPPYYGQRIFQASALIDCARLMRLRVYGTSEPHNVNLDLARKLLRSCKNLTYVYVLRTRRLEGLEFSGDVIAFDVDSGRHLGGFALDFKSAPRIDVVKDTSTRIDQTSRGGRLVNKRIVTTGEHLVRNDFGAIVGDIDARIEENLRRLMPGLRWLD